MQLSNFYNLPFFNIAYMYRFESLSLQCSRLALSLAIRQHQHADWVIFQSQLALRHLKDISIHATIAKNLTKRARRQRGESVDGGEMTPSEKALSLLNRLIIIKQHADMRIKALFNAKRLAKKPIKEEEDDEIEMYKAVLPEEMEILQRQIFDPQPQPNCLLQSPQKPLPSATKLIRKKEKHAQPTPTRLLERQLAQQTKKMSGELQRELTMVEYKKLAKKILAGVKSFKGTRFQLEDLITMYTLENFVDFQQK